MQKNRILWIDLVKIIACFLVVLGHVFNGLISAGVCSPDGPVAVCHGILYFFHVYLFFFCSGYLYVLTAKPGFSNHFHNFGKKVFDFVIPYVFFTTVSYILKLLFENDVNSAITNSYLVTLTLRPLAPYWFLYALLFMFLITPVFKKRRNNLFVFFASVIMKAVYVLFLTDVKILPLFRYILENEIWFSLGIVAASYDIVSLLKKKCVRIAALTAGAVFIPLSVIVEINDIDFPFMQEILCVLGMTLTVTVCWLICGERDIRFVNIASAYTMPVFLMHTILAPALRAVLLRMSITNPVIHIVGGILAGVMVPVLIAYVMKKTVFLDFVLYPRATLRKIKEQKRKMKDTIEN